MAPGCIAAVVIGRKELVCLFSSVLTRDAGRANTGWKRRSERGRIQVEETPWVAVELGLGLFAARGPANA